MTVQTKLLYYKAAIPKALSAYAAGISDLKIAALILLHNFYVVREVFKAL